MEEWRSYVPQLRPGEAKQINKDFLKKKKEITTYQNRKPWAETSMEDSVGKKILILPEELLKAQGGKTEK